MSLLQEIIYCSMVGVILCAGSACAAVQLSNVARGKPAEQSSASTRFSLLTADKAVDGDYTNSLHYCQHTADQDEGDTNPFRWWIVDLQGFYEIHAVVVTNRGDCCGGRLKNFDVEVFIINPLTNADATPARCYHHSGSMAGGVTEEFNCSQPIRGRYVRIIMPSEGVPMHVCEVEVLARISDFFSSTYTCTQGQKAVGDVIREVTSRGDISCFMSCAQDVSCNAVNKGSPVVTSLGSRSRTCQLLSFGGIGQPGSTNAQSDWDFCLIAEN